MELEINLPEDFTESTETIELTKPRKKRKFILLLKLINN